MAKPGHIIVNVRAGPLLAAVTEVLASAEEFAELIPDWHADERERFIERCRQLQTITLRAMKLEQT